MAVGKRNILLVNITDNMAYKSSSYPVKKNYPKREDYSSHAGYIKNQLDNVVRQAKDQKQVAAIKMNGMYAEFSGD